MGNRAINAILCAMLMVTVSLIQVTSGKAVDIELRTRRAADGDNTSTDGANDTDYTYRQYQTCLLQQTSCRAGQVVDYQRCQCVQQCPVASYFSGSTCVCTNQGAVYDQRLNQCVFSQNPCGRGQFYDTASQRCNYLPVRQCPQGSYQSEDTCVCTSQNTVYDARLNQCVYDQTQCAAGQTYDSVSGRCVYDQTQCAMGQTYDRVSGRCVYDQTQCAVGQIYDSFSGRCVYDQTQCAVGQTYDSVSGRCVYSQTQCQAGQYYDSASRSCRYSAYQCPAGQSYDQSMRRCVPTQCPTGSYYDYNTRDCVTDNQVQNLCSVGSYYDYNTGRCEPNTNPQQGVQCPNNARPTCVCRDANNNYDETTRQCIRSDQNVFRQQCPTDSYRQGNACVCNNNGHYFNMRSGQCENLPTVRSCPYNADLQCHCYSAYQIFDPYTRQCMNRNF